ncbi:hypothetical protein B0G71_4363 [Paraburkholderia sp. BL27I4N3]|uniref:hypothetical protein n=1 Tax=Paraburkholderia sp. BL27I4N3 TaxID=1938805 RepID=UPI000E2681D0|nr:hypothetical protein [Paraburkholderia sp. BL27I4N3]REE21211.1 hypothetical protein B0G71_4363 [Paraburkholderia sp. BL27I4N3]
MKGRFVRRVKGEDAKTNMAFTLVNDPLAMDLEVKAVITMPIISDRKKGVFKLIVLPWADPLLAKDSGKE